MPTPDASDRTAGVPQDREFLTPAEFVQITGISMPTVRRYLKSGRLPKVQLGGPRSRVLIPREAVAVQLGPGQDAAADDEDPTDRVTDDSEPAKDNKSKHGPVPRWIGRR